MCQKRDDLNKQILQSRCELSKICPIQEVNSKLFNHLHQIKTQKFEQLTVPPITCDSSLESLNTVVTIPEHLSLSDAEKSVLSKGLNFVPISKKLDEFSVKQDVEKFLRGLQLKAFLHDKEDDSNTSDKDIFETLQTRKSKWTPPEGQFASLDFFIKKYRHDINKLNFNRITKFSNLSSEERAALENLSKLKDLIVKVVDKGGALVVWRADLYQKEALRQLSDTSFMLKSIKISLPLINKLSRALLTTLQSNKNCRLLLLISSSPLLELRVFTFYPKFTNLITQADLSSLRVVALQNLFPAI